MGLESSVSKIADLNDAWPLGTDDRSTTDDHLRNIKTALKSLLTDLTQIGFDCITYNLSATATTVDYTGVMQKGARLAVILIQDATGGRSVTFAAKFKLVTADEVNPLPSKTTVLEFVHDGTNYYLCGRYTD